MSDLTQLPTSSLVLMAVLFLVVVLIPWLSLTNLNKLDKLDDIEYELRKIRESLEKRKE